EIEPGIQELQLLGQAGKNVYSAAIRFDGRLHEIGFDFCLRTPVTVGVPPVLATYQMPVAPGEGPQLENASVSCRIPTVGAQIGILEVTGAMKASRLRPPLQLVESARRLQITGESAAEITANAARRSLRWRYRLRLAASA